MSITSLCKPALIYLIFSLVQVIIDTLNGYFNVALLKILTTFIVTTFFNYLCKQGLGIVSWIFIFIPFILKSVIITILLLTLGLDPTTGRLYKNARSLTHNKKHKKDKKQKKVGKKEKKLEIHHLKHKNHEEQHKKIDKLLHKSDRHFKNYNTFNPQQTEEDKSLNTLLSKLSNKEIDIEVTI